MKTVARRVATSLFEAKRFAIINESATPTFVGSRATNWNVRSIFGPIPQLPLAGLPSNSSYTRVGSEIVDPLFKAKFTFTVNWGAVFAGALSAYGTIDCVVMIVKAIDVLTTPNTFSDYPVTGTTGDPGWFIQQQADRVTMNGNNCKIVKRWHRRVTPQNVSAAGSKIQKISGQIKYRRKGKITYQDEVVQQPVANYNSTSTLEGYNYYILVGYTMTSPVAQAYAPNVLMDSYVYFKDP